MKYKKSMKKFLRFFEIILMNFQKFCQKKIQSSNCITVCSVASLLAK